MRLPFIQVTQETWAKARMLAGLLAISRREAMGLIADLWAWGVDLGPQDEAPTGEVRGTKAPQKLAGALEWAGDARALVDALVEVELVAETPEGLRVRGLDRYKRTWEKNRRRTGATGAGNRRAPAEKPAPQTQTETQTDKKEASPQRPPQGGGAGKASPPALDANGDSLAERMGAVFRAAKGRDYALRRGDVDALARLTRAEGDAEVLRRWAIGVAWLGYPSCSTWAELEKHWNHFAKPKEAGPPGKARDVTRGVVRAEEAKHAPVGVISNFGGAK